MSKKIIKGILSPQHSSPERFTVKEYYVYMFLIKNVSQTASAVILHGASVCICVGLGAGIPLCLRTWTCVWMY